MAGRIAETWRQKPGMARAGKRERSANGSKDSTAKVGLARFRDAAA